MERDEGYRTVGRRIVARGAWLLVGVVLWGIAGDSARADARTDARRYFRRGMAMIAEGKANRDPDQVERGIEELIRAYETLPHPNVLYNVARAYVDLGDYDKALDFFRRYLDTDPEDRETVLRYIAALEERIAARRREEEARRAAREAAEAPEEAAQAQEGPAPTMPAATEEEIANLEAAAQRLDALAQATGSQELRERAEALRTFAQALRERRLAAPAAGTSGESVQQAQQAEAAEAGGTADEGGEPASSEGASEPSEPEGSGAERFAEDILGEETEVERGGQDIYEERVVSSSRVAESPLRAPNSTASLSAQDLRLSARINPLEALRRVAGVELMVLAPSYPQLSIRGLNERISRRLIVMVDGRTIYLDFLGLSLWTLVPMAVEDLERVEVIRGPASAIYGADALTGVVNLISRRPGEGRNYLALGMGNEGQARALLGLHHREGRLRLRLGAGYEGARTFGRFSEPGRVDVQPGEADPTTGFRRRWAGGEGELRLTRGVSLRFGSGVTQADQSVHGVGRIREVLARDAVFVQSFVQVATRAGFSSRVFWNRFSTRHGVVVAPEAAIPEGIGGRLRRQDVVDAEVLYSGNFKLGGRLSMELVSGLSYRFKYVAWDWMSPDPETGERSRTQHHFAAFLQDRLRFGRSLELVGSVRADRHPLLDGIQVSPRGSVLWHPGERQTVRLMGATAFRGPTFLESYLRLPYNTPIRGVTAYAEGNTNLRPERILSLEVGYMAEDPDAFTFEANAYLNRVFDQMVLADVRFARLRDTATEPRFGFSDDFAAYPFGEVGFRNEDPDFVQYGGEVGVKLFPVRGLDVYANYAFHRTEPVSDQPLGGEEKDQRTSAHKVNVGVQYRTQFGLDLSADFSWVSSQVWADPQVVLRPGDEAFIPYELPAYAVLDARVGYRLFDDKLELSVAGNNLLMEHREHPFAQTLDRRVMAHATLRF